MRNVVAILLSIACTAVVVSSASWIPGIGGLFRIGLFFLLVGLSIFFGYGFYCFWMSFLTIRARKKKIKRLRKEVDRRQFAAANEASEYESEAAAVAAAKAGLEGFAQVLAERPPECRRFRVRVDLPTPSGEPEPMWLKKVRWTGRRFRGTVSRDPERNEDVVAGQEIEVGAKSVTDWRYERGAEVVGGFTERLRGEEQTTGPLAAFLGERAKERRMLRGPVEKAKSTWQRVRAFAVFPPPGMPIHLLREDWRAWRFPGSDIAVCLPMGFEATIAGDRVLHGKLREEPSFRVTARLHQDDAFEDDPRLALEFVTELAKRRMKKEVRRKQKIVEQGSYRYFFDPTPVGQSGSAGLREVVPRTFVVGVPGGVVELVLPMEVDDPVHPIARQIAAAVPRIVGTDALDHEDVD